MTNRNRTLDRLRGLGAVAVVLLHAPPLYHSGVPALRNAGWVLREFCQLAVPFFFVLSGWHMGRKWESGRQGWSELAGTLARIGKLYLPWFLLFEALDIVQGLPHGWIAVVRRFAGFSDSSLDTRGYHLWFLPSLALAQVLCWCSLRRFRSILPALIPGIGLFAFLGWMEMAGGKLPWGLAFHEGFNLSLGCTAMGVLVGRLPKGGPVLPNWSLLAMSLLVVLESATMDSLSGTHWAIHPFQFTRLALPTILLLWAVHHPDAGGDASPGRSMDFLGRVSPGIYTSHIAFLSLIPFESLVTNGFLRDNLVRWPVAIAGSALLSLLLSRSRFKIVRDLVR